MNIIFRSYFWFSKLANAHLMSQLKKKFKYCGINVRIETDCNIVVPSNFEIGENSSISHNTTIFATFGVQIGKNCLISSNCGISSYNHIANSANRYADMVLGNDKKFSSPVTIGDNVWIGTNVCILPGVKIGNNSIIGAGSVVTKNVPSNEIWVGNPAHLIKSLTIDH
jgi:acetyltransferase-like isoleucine patch superfamily enzyme